MVGLDGWSGGSSVFRVFKKKTYERSQLIYVDGKSHSRARLINIITGQWSQLPGVAIHQMAALILCS